MGNDTIMDKGLFSELGLSPELLKAVEGQGFEQPSPIQAGAIPPALAGRDVVGQSQTGSGKTMAFAVPVVQLVDPKVRHMQALILCPTRELANQVCEEVHKLAMHKPGMKAVPVYGGSSYERQIRGIEGGAQVVVGTPGRVLDMVNRRILKLENVKFLVFDEADAMLDMGFREEIDEVMAKVPAERQTLFFSATLSGPIRYLIDKYTKNAAIVTIEHKALTVPTVEQSYYEVQSRSKVEVLTRVLDIEQPRLAIVFANTKRMVDETTDSLMARGYAVDRLHGDLNQNMRERVLKNFRSGAVEVLIATDVAARGLDVNDIDLVVNLELPYDEEDYVHRIGRTGRAGRTGKAVSFLSGREIFLFQRIMRFTKGKAERKSVPSQEDLAGKRADSFFDKLKEKVEGGAFHNHENTLQRLLDAGHSITDVSSCLMDLWMAETAREREEIMEDRARPAPRERKERKDSPAGEKPWRDDGAQTPSTNSAPAGERSERPARTERPAISNDGFKRLFLNLGAMDEVSPGDIAGAIYREAALPAGSLGRIEIFERCSYVGVPEEYVEQVMSTVGQAKWRGRPLRMDVADRQDFGDGNAARKPGGFTKRPYGAGGGGGDRGGYRSGGGGGYGGGAGRGDGPPRAPYGKKPYGKKPPREGGY